jgi:hypothetical protein
MEILFKNLNYVSLDDFYPRYKFSNHVSHEEGIFDISNDLTSVMKKNLSLEQADMANLPILYRINTDRYGFRNSNKKSIKNYDTVFVGDSLTFGYGVENYKTFVSRYAKESNEKVYNLSTPNIGPASYMYLIDEFLKTRSAKNINIMFYSANDFSNLNNSFWRGMDNGTPPINTRIIRQDLNNKNILYPDYMFYPILRQSSILLYLHNIFNLTDNVKFKKHEFLNLKNLLIDYLTRGATQNLHTEEITIYLSELRSFGKKLNNDNFSFLLNEIDSKYKSNDNKDLFKLTQELAILMNDLNIWPISEKYKINLSVYLNSQLGYGSDNKFDNGYDGLVSSMINVLSGIKDNKYENDVNQIKKILKNYKNINISELNGLLIKVSNYYEKIAIKQISLESKLQIFLEYLKNLSKSGINVKIYNYTGEYTLKAKYINNRICELANKYDLSCNNLTPLIRGYYHNKENNLNALYLDGAHFNSSGHNFILNQLTKDKK